ncbi:hypothetical protein OG453_38660 [Streptomyces sp. NBC_01381]|uniref:hypothetical protein n=1 Tax=Streptomyces sp. NBC_01381 TaxID=2903845 RepID=UPI0022590438|nr:hypothetical protein [Streptomyces sp. NBC_01381]MCX4672504.1 hypothetical protein [Streptomyces sp. NBC_01381]
MTSDSEFPRQDGTTPELPLIKRLFRSPPPPAQEAFDPGPADDAIDDTLYPVAQEHLWEEPGPDELPEVDYEKHMTEVLHRSAELRARREETQALEEAFAAPAAEHKPPRPRGGTAVVALDSALVPGPAERAAESRDESYRATAGSGARRWKGTLRLGLSSVLLIAAALVPCITLGVILFQGSSIGAWIGAWIGTWIAAAGGIVVIRVFVLVETLRSVQDGEGRGRRGAQMSRARHLSDRQARAARAHFSMPIRTEEDDVKKQS